MSRSYDVAVYDAASLAGETLLNVLEECDIELGAVYALAESVDEEVAVSFKGTELDVLNAFTFNFADADLLFLPVGCKAPAEILNLATENNCVVIDGSVEASAPVVVPGVNEELLPEAFDRKMVAIPSSPAALLLPVLKPIQDAVGIDSVSVVACQSVSDSGNEGIAELRGQTVDLLNGKPVKKKLYSQRVAFNLLPEVGETLDDGSTSEEARVVQELTAGLDQDDLRVSPTCIRVPVFFGDSLAVHLDLDRSLDADSARDLIAGATNVILAEQGEVPTVESAAGEDYIQVGRIRQNPELADQLSLWLVADPVKRGALNALGVAEILLKDFLK